MVQYVDTAEYIERHCMFLAVVDSLAQIHTGGSIQTRSTETVKEAAIAYTHCHYIISSSKQQYAIL